MIEESLDDADRLGLLVDAVLLALDQGEAIDEIALAARFRLSATEVADCIAGLKAVHGYSWDFHDDGIGEVPAHQRPELPSDYELLEELGRGGMGVVYRARQHSLNREVAVKVLRPGDAFLERALQRFEKEARSLAQLRHPNVVTIHEVGRREGQVYFTMDLIRGQSLHDLICSDSLTPTQSLKIVRQVASAIAYTHEQGIIHRDLKPLNILMDEAGKPYVTDFGLARHLNDSIDLTRSGQVLGTPHYMSPEQARGEIDRIAEPSDVWGLGAILYECLCGQPPFPGSSPIAVLHDLVHKSPQRPSKLKRSAPPGLEAIALKALSKEPKDRYPTARAFLEDLERFEQGRSPRADISNPYLSLVAFGRRHSSTLLSGLVVAAIMLLTFVLTVLPRLGNDPETLTSLADRLWEEGSIEAAATAYDAAEQESISVEVMKRIIEGRAAQARRLREEGRPEESLRLLESLSQRCSNWVSSTKFSVSSSSPFPEWTGLQEQDCVVLDVELALSICLARGPDAAIQFIPAFLPSGTWNSWLHSKNPIVTEVFDHIDEVGSPLRDLGIKLILTENPIRVRNLLMRNYSEHRGKLSLAIIQNPDWGLIRQNRDLVTMIASVDRPTFDAVLAMARQRDLSQGVRSLAAAFLELALELPQTRTNVDIAEKSEQELLKLTDLCARILNADAVHAFWLRCEEALRLLAAGEEKAGRWLAELGIDPGSRSGDELQLWWAELPKNDPVPSWRREAQIPADLRAGGLLKYLDAEDFKVRRTADRILRWLRGLQESWPLLVDNMVPSRALWESTLLPTLTLSESYVCHAAAFSINDGILEAEAGELKTLPLQLLHSTSRLPAIEELSRTVLDSMPVASCFRAPGFMEPKGGDNRRTLSAMYFSPALVWNEPLPCLTLDAYAQSSPGSLVLKGQWAKRVVSQNWGIGLSSDGIFPLFIAYPKDKTDFDPRKLDEWRRAAKLNLEDCIQTLESKSSHDATILAPPLMRLVAQIGLPESLDRLKVLDDLIAQHQHRNSELRMLLSLGRVMSGDQEVMRSLDHESLPDDSSGISVPKDSSDFLIQVALNSPVVEARRWAEERLSQLELTEERRQFLKKAHERRPFMNSRLIAQVNAGDALSARLDRILKQAPEQFTLATFLWFLVAIALGVTVLPKRRLMGAGYLVVAGTLMAMFHIEAEGVLLVPGAAGWFVAALGAALLIRRIKSHHRFFALGVFLVTGFLQVGVDFGFAWLAFPLCFAEWSSALVLLLLCRLYDEEFDEFRGHRLFGALPLASLALGIPVLLFISAILGRVFGFEDLAFALGSLLIMALLFWGLMVMQRRSWTQPSILPRFLLLSYFPLMLLFNGLSWVHVAAGGGNRGFLGPHSPWMAVATVSYLTFMGWLFLLASFGSFKRKRRPQEGAQPLIN